MKRELSSEAVKDAMTIEKYASKLNTEQFVYEVAL